MRRTSTVPYGPASRKLASRRELPAPRAPMPPPAALRDTQNACAAFGACRHPPALPARPTAPLVSYAPRASSADAQGGVPSDMQSVAARRSEAGEGCHSGAWRVGRQRWDEWRSRPPAPPATRLTTQTAGWRTEPPAGVCRRLTASEASRGQPAAQPLQPQRARSRLPTRRSAARHRAPVGHRFVLRWRSACVHHEDGGSPSCVTGRACRAIRAAQAMHAGTLRDIDLSRTGDATAVSLAETTCAAALALRISRVASVW